MDYFTYLCSMRNQREIDLAIASIEKDMETAPEYNYFGDNNHEKMRLGLSILQGLIDEDELDQMGDDEEITSEEYNDAYTYIEYLNGDVELVEMLFNPENIVTE